MSVKKTFYNSKIKNIFAKNVYNLQKCQKYLQNSAFWLDILSPWGI
jgi:hypothetical protein